MSRQVAGEEGRTLHSCLVPDEVLVGRRWAGGEILSRVPGQVDLRIKQGQVDPTDLEGSPDVQIWGRGFFHFVGKDYKPPSVPK